MSFLRFSKFYREQQSKTYFLHYKTCPLTSLSSKKSQGIFALSIENIDFFFFSYTNLRGHHKKVTGGSRSIRYKIFLHSPWSYNKLSVDSLIIKSFIRKILSFRLKVSKILFRTATLNIAEQSILTPRLFLIAHFEENKFRKYIQLLK